MSGRFAAASSRRLENATPFTLAVPFTVGVWVSLASLGTTRYVFSLADTGTATNFFYVRISTANIAVMGANDGTDTSTSASTTAFTVDGWAFILARWIAGNNRKLAAIAQDGSFATGSSTTSRAPTGIDKMTLGALGHNAPTLHMDGRIAEFWIANNDVQGDGATTTETLTRELARRGPFALPHVRAALVEYRSLRLDPLADRMGETYYGAGAAIQNWSNVNGVTSDAHPPLAYSRRKPIVNTRIIKW